MGVGRVVFLVYAPPTLKKTKVMPSPFPEWTLPGRLHLVGCTNGSLQLSAELLGGTDQPVYVARMNHYTVNDRPEEDVGIMYRMWMCCGKS